jgi:hypothetical protein
LTQTFVRVILKTEQTFGGENIMFMNEQLLTKQEPATFPRLFSTISPRRKRFRIIGLFTAVFFIITISLSLSLLGAEQDAYASSEQVPLKQTVEIVKGDTLWAIASQHVHRGQKVRDYLNELKELNRLTSSVLQEGQILKLP